MKVPIKLNDNELVLEADPSMTLLDVLRREGFISPKLGCSRGSCGACTVLLDGKAIPTCIVPLVVARDATIVTLEYFSKTKEHELIMEAFAKAGIQLCGFCNSGKILGAYSLITTHPRPSRQLIYDMVRHFDCSCTEQDSLIQGILYASVALQNHASNWQVRENKNNRNSRNGRKGKN
ncbi:MAG: 2Fe-2S iron-sulfur cluster binding domain-containing protein [Spirochaetaceae bacterium]|nr:2Fe-2S iron-sulfur cluster binding domain-containing protein [Spirochaetaceae bacterium]